MKKIHYNCGNDNGNSQHKLYINKKLFVQPNVYYKATKSPWKDDYSPTSLIPNLLDNLVVTIDSPSVNPGIYFIGSFALKSTDVVTSMDVRVGEKHLEDVPIINTLGLIAGKAIQDAFEEEKDLPKNINVTIDMATALPARQWNKDTARIFKERFIKDSHRVTVHIKQERVNVEITFEHVEVLAEGVPATFAIQSDLNGKVRKGEMFDQFAKDYNLPSVDGSYFKDKMILHDDIGDGSTEFVVTVGAKFLDEHIDGINSGIGHAIDDAMPDFEDKTGLGTISRQDYSRYLTNKGKFTARAIECLTVPLETQVRMNLQRLTRQFDKTKNEVEVVCVYGGGSIVMKDIINVLEEPLKTFVHSKGREAMLLYIPAQFATKLNAEGLAIFVDSPIFKRLKEMALVKE